MRPVDGDLVNFSRTGFDKVCDVYWLPVPLVVLSGGQVWMVTLDERRGGRGQEGVC